MAKRESAVRALRAIHLIPRRVRLCRTRSGRLRTFRQMAADARRLAARSTNPEMCRGFEQLAKAWELLIRELEKRG